VVTASAVGLPDEQIVNFARQNAIDLIVMSTHGRGGLSRVRAIVLNRKDL
jgi:nucleotide-binding universal stress UspA family protein